MPIRLILENQAPVRLHKRGAVSGTQEWTDIINAMKTVKKDQAIIVDLPPADFKDTKKPEVAFAYALRRYFTVNGIMATAYQSGNMQVTVKHASAPPTTNKRKGK